MLFGICVLLKAAKCSEDDCLTVEPHKSVKHTNLAYNWCFYSSGDNWN